MKITVRSKCIVACLTLMISASAGISAYATSVSSGAAGYQKQADGTYKRIEKYVKEDRTFAKDEWIHFGNHNGCEVWKYFGSDNNVLSNTTTPDGYLVNNKGEWYEHCPDAAYCTVESYNIDNYIFPFSYDGSVAKNDYLGMILNYTAQDYADGYELTMLNTNTAAEYSCMILTLPNQTLPNGSYTYIRVSNSTRGNEEEISQWVRHTSGGSVEPMEYLVAGRQFRGHQFFSNSDNSIPTTVYLYYPVENVQIQLGMKANSDEEYQQMLTWLDSHIEFN